MNPYLHSKPRATAGSKSLERLEAFVETHPAQALAAAVGAGLVVRLLPRRLTRTLVGRLVIRTLPPTLVALGMLKAWELLAGPPQPPHGGAVFE